MGKKVLLLKLFHKGKLLYHVQAERDFKNKLYIGNDKYLFLQIPDDKFPSKYLFIKRKNGKYYLQLGKGMELQQEGVPVEGNSLQGKNSSQQWIELSGKSAGYVKISPDWTISYEFVELTKPVYSKEELQLISQYSHHSELDPYQKHTRNFLLCTIALTIIGIILFDYFKPVNQQADTLTQLWEQAQATATKVEVPPSTEPEFAYEDKNANVSIQSPQNKGSNSKGYAKGGSATGLAGFFGKGSQSGKNLYAVTTEEDIVAATLGGSIGGKGYGGTGTGIGGSGKGAGSGGGGLGVGPGTGYGSVFNPEAVPSGTANLAGLSTGRPKGLSSQAPVGDVSTYVGSAQRLVAPVGKPGTYVPSSVITRFSGPEVKKVSEGNIGSAPADTRPELQRIELTVSRYKPQIRDLYIRYSQIKAMYGTLKFLLYLDSDGTVAGVQITPMSGEFYPEFISQLEKLIKNWRFDNQHLVPYEFIMTFTK